MGEMFPRGKVFYRLDPKHLFSEGESVFELIKTMIEGSMGRDAVRSQVTGIVDSSPALRMMKRDEVVVDLSSPWPIGIRSRLNASRDKDGWTMHLDQRILRPAEMIAEISVDVEFGTICQFEWTRAVWKDDHAHHLVKTGGMSYKFIGRDPEILMAMMIAVFEDVKNPKGLVRHA